MQKSIKRLAAAAALAIAVSATAGAASATIINISATNSIGTDLAVTPGQYLIEFIGTANGGAYNAWNGSCPTGDCTSGWRDQFNVTVAAEPGFANVFIVPGNPGYASALLSLAAYQGAPFLVHNTFQNGNLVETEQVNQPFIADIDGATTLTFRAGDGSPTDNFGGVSLRITAVPEPTVWGMLIVGFGLIGGAMRRRSAGLQGSQAAAV